MNEGAKQAYLDKMNAQLAEWSATIDVVKARVAKGTAGVRIDYHNQIEAWTKKEPELKTTLDDIRAASVEGFESVKAGAQSVWNDISARMSELSKSLEEKKN